MLIHMKNLPEDVESINIREFFHGLSIPNGGVHIASDDDAFVKFSLTQDILQATEYDGRKLLGQPITVLLCTEDEKEDIIKNIRAQRHQKSEIEPRQAQHVVAQSQFYDKAYYLAVTNISSDTNMNDIKSFFRVISSGLTDDGIVVATHRQPPVAFIRVWERDFYLMALSLSGRELRGHTIGVNRCNHEDFENNCPLSYSAPVPSFMPDPSPRQALPLPTVPKLPKPVIPSVQDDVMQGIRQVKAILEQQQVLETLKNNAGPTDAVVFQGESVKPTIASRELLLRLAAEKVRLEGLPSDLAKGNLPGSSHQAPMPSSNAAVFTDYFHGKQAETNHGGHMKRPGNEDACYVMVDQLPSKADAKWIRWFLNDCVIMNDNISIVSYDSKALYAYVALQAPIDVSKAIMKDSMRIGNDILSVSAVSKEKVYSDLENLPPSLSVEKGAKPRSNNRLQTGKQQPNLTVNFIHRGPGDVMKVAAQNIEPHPASQFEPLMPPRQVSGPIRPLMGPEPYPTNRWRESSGESRKKKVKFDESNVETRMGSHVTQAGPDYPKVENIQVEGLPLHSESVRREVLEWLKINNVEAVGEFSYYKLGEGQGYYVGHVPANGHINPTLPKTTIIADKVCKISHNLQTIPHCHACRNFDCPSGEQCKSCSQKFTKSFSFLIEHKVTPKLPPGDASHPFMYQGHLYPSVLVALMAVMARAMGLHDIAARIAVANSPAKLKDLSHKIDKYDSLNWEKDNLDVLVDIYREKYKQVPEFSEELRKTGKRPIVYLNMRSTLGVGIFLAKKDWLKSVNPAYFPGLNQVGRALMIIRQENLNIPFVDYIPKGRFRILPPFKMPTETLMDFTPKTPRADFDDVEMEDVQDVHNVGQPANNDGMSPPPPPPPPPKVVSKSKNPSNDVNDTNVAVSGKTFLVLEGLPLGDGVTQKTVLSWLEATPQKIKPMGEIKTWKRGLEPAKVHQITVMKMEVENRLDPALPRHVFVNGFACKIVHTLQAEACLACRALDKLECDLLNCPGFSDNEDVYCLDSGKTSLLSPNDLFCPFQFGGLKQFSVNLALMWKMSHDLGYRDVAENIRTAIEPHKYSALVKKLQDYQCMTWEFKNYQVLKEIFLAKWDATPLFQKALEDTEDKIIVYQHPRATLGMGLFYHRDRARIKPSYLPGLNYVGQALMEIRKEKFPNLDKKELAAVATVPSAAAKEETAETMLAPEMFSQDPSANNSDMAVSMPVVNDSMDKEKEPIMSDTQPPGTVQHTGEDNAAVSVGATDDNLSMVDATDRKCSEVQIPSLMAKNVVIVPPELYRSESQPITQLPF